jgi:hypothetical protein
LDGHSPEPEVAVLLSRSNAEKKRLRRFSRTLCGSALQSRNNGRLNALLIDLIKDYRTVGPNTGTISEKLVERISSPLLAVLMTLSLRYCTQLRFHLPDFAHASTMNEFSAGSSSATFNHLSISHAFFEGV